MRLAASFCYSCSCFIVAPPTSAFLAALHLSSPCWRTETKLTSSFFATIIRLRCEWIRLKQLKVLVIFEGRDTAGKGGVISRIASAVPTRVCRVVALPAPTERQRTQWYFQARC